MKIRLSPCLIFVIFCIWKVGYIDAANCGCPAVVQEDEPEEEEEEQNLDAENDSGTTDDQLQSKINDEVALEDQLFSSILSSGASAAVLPSTSTTPPVEQCIAVKAPKANQHLSYDPRYQAITIEEAVSNFVDLTVADRPLEEMDNLFGRRPKFFDQQTGLPNGLKLKCDSTSCSNCAKILAWKLEYDPNVERKLYSEDANTAGDTVAKQSFTMNFGGGLNARRDKPYCPLLNKTIKNYHKLKRLKMKSSELSKILDTAKISRSTGGQNPIPRITRDVKSPQSRIVPLSTVIGKSVKIDCKYRRGDRLDEKTNLCGLCNLCWTIRLLPEKYFPRFINEITCDKNASRCLSGHGVCREKWRNLVALIDVGSDAASDRPKWEQVDVTTSVACECLVYENSALYSVAKN